jgi:hypothetical protein
MFGRLKCVELIYVKDIWQTEMRTANLRDLESSAFESQMDVEKLKRYKSPELI